MIMFSFTIGTNKSANHSSPRFKHMGMDSTPQKWILVSK